MLGEAWNQKLRSWKRVHAAWGGLKQKTEILKANTAFLGRFETLNWDLLKESPAYVKILKAGMPNSPNLKLNPNLGLYILYPNSLPNHVYIQNIS